MIKLPRISLFTRKEAFGVGIIFFLIILSIVVNLTVSERKGRDAQRKMDVRTVADALERYRTDFGSYPDSENGKIVACDSGKINDQGLPVLRACAWGVDSLADVSDPKYPKYLERIPVDPKSSKGYSYYYLSTGKFYQLFAALEGSMEAEYDPRIIARNLLCGTKVCNFGLASSHTPIDKSLEEYENELLKK